jgi:hypothetical protein
LGKSGIKPEQLPAKEDIKKLESRVKSADKEIVKKKTERKRMSKYEKYKSSNIDWIVAVPECFKNPFAYFV